MADGIPRGHTVASISISASRYIFKFAEKVLPAQMGRVSGVTSSRWKALYPLAALKRSMLFLRAILRNPNSLLSTTFY